MRYRANDASTLSTPHLEACAIKARRAAHVPNVHFMANRRMVLLDVASHIRRSMSLALILLLLVLITLLAYVAFATSMNAHAVGMAAVICFTLALRALTIGTEAAWFFVYGTVVVEAICLCTDACRPLESFVAEQAWGLHGGVPVIAAGWFLGGLAFGFQALPAATLVILQAVGTLLLMLRVLIVYARVREVLILTRALPSTTGSFVLGGLLARTLVSAAPIRKWAEQLEGVEGALARCQGTWMRLLDDYSSVCASMRLMAASSDDSPTASAAEHEPMTDFYPSALHSQTKSGLCTLCMERPYTNAYVPCMHRCVCEECSRKWPHICPLCRSQSTACLRIFDA